MNVPRALLLSFLVILAAPTVTLAAADGSGFEVPRGATAAVVIFEDLQCPDCAQAHPKLMEITQASKVPLVIHDFPITRHVWAFPAAVLARYFAQQSPELGIEFRSYLFANQKDVDPETLRPMAEKFAADHGLTLPAIVDPDGKLKDLVQAEFDLGMKIGLQYVPLIFVVGRGTGTEHWVEVTDLTQLAPTIEKMKQVTGQ